MWRNTKKAGSHKSVEWEMFESKHYQKIWFLKKYNSIFKIFTPCFIHMKVKKVRIMIAVFFVLQTISTNNICQLYCLFIKDDHWAVIDS